MDLNFITEFIFVEDEIAPCEVILVPGGSRPQLAEKAAALYKNRMAKYILFSGRANYKIPEFFSEAEYLKSVAINSGVPAENIICENEAANTFENAEFSLALLNKMNFHIGKFILVCKAFHSRRALLTYQYAFPETAEFLVAPVEDNRGLNRNNWTTKDEYVKIVMNEVEKVGKYFGNKIFCMNRCKDEDNARKRTDSLPPISIDTRGWKFEKEEANER